jgi:membrane protein DedA with SNARE-associated domain
MQPIIDFFQYCLHNVPLEIFVLIGTFIEEIISPVPSFLVLVPAGATAAARDYAYWYLFVLMVCSAVGRICGSVILYKAADKLEDVALKRRRFFGVSHKQIERIGQRVGQGRKRDWAMLFLINAVPVFPTAMLSLACGFLKVNFKMFVFCAFFGTMINALIFMSIGYLGVRVTETLQGFQLAGRITTAIVLIALLIWFVNYRRRLKHGGRAASA